MKNQTDVYGNIGEITSSHDRMKNHTPKKHLGRIILCTALGLATLTGIGAGVYKLTDYAIRTDRASYASGNIQGETILERRVRLLILAEKQLLEARNPETIRGLNSIIRDIENGVYDRTK
jgi:hypothetical protein